MKRMNSSNLRFLIAALAFSTLALGGTALAALPEYDAAVAADHGGGAPYAAVLKNSVTLDGTNSEAFDFGAVSGSSTIEFIVSGDPVAGGRNGYLGAGENTTFSLRYEQWDDTGQLGFTHGGVADYVFDPAVPSPEATTHLTYRWDNDAELMEVFLNGDLASSLSAPGFEMPTGAGLLGNVEGGNEGLVGSFDRVTVYDSALDVAIIKSHSDAWQVPEPSGVLLLTLAACCLATIRRRR